MEQAASNGIQVILRGADLRKVRLEAGLTTVKMATLAGVKTRKTYENWERGQGSPNVNQFVAMMIGCGKDAPQFMAGLIQQNLA